MLTETLSHQFEVGFLGHTFSIEPYYYFFVMVNKTYLKPDFLLAPPFIMSFLNTSLKCIYWSYPSPIP